MATTTHSPDGHEQVCRSVGVEWSVDAILQKPPFTRWSAMESNAEKLERLARDLVTEIGEAMDPRAVYAVEPRERTDIAAFSPPDVLTDADYVVAAVVTLGDPVESVSPDGDGLTDDFVGETLKNLALMRARERVAEAIRDDLSAHGLGTTGVVAPGSELTDWGMEGQAFVARQVDAGRIGVTLPDESLPEPRRTYTFAMGADPEFDETADLFSCQGCEKRGACPYVGIGCGQP